jgi:hypothetical protein
MRASLWADRLLDAAVYAVSITAVFAAISAIVSLPLGNVLTGVKWGLFITGWLTLAYATFQLRPTPSWRRVGEDAGDTKTKREETRFQAWVQRVPPLRRRSLPPEKRFPVALKLFIGGVVVLATSFLMEAAFGVGG